MTFPYLYDKKEYFIKMVRQTSLEKNKTPMHVSYKFKEFNKEDPHFPESILTEHPPKKIDNESDREEQSELDITFDDSDEKALEADMNDMASRLNKLVQIKRARCKNMLKAKEVADKDVNDMMKEKIAIISNRISNIEQISSNSKRLALANLLDVVDLLSIESIVN